MEERFWRWCGDGGATARQMELRSIASKGNSRGLCVVDRAPHGAVLLAVPFRMVLSAETVPLGLLPPTLPPAALIRKLFKAKMGIRSLIAMRFIWLSAAVAAIAVSPEHRKVYLPYLQMLPSSIDTALEAPARRLFPQLEKGEQHVFLHAHRHGKRAVSLLSRLFNVYAARKKLSGCVPQVGAVEWAYRMVMSRAVSLPINCAPSTPLPLLEFIAKGPASVSPDNDSGDADSDEDTIDTLPSMIPMIDFINAASNGEDPNCELYTCDATPKSLPGSISLSGVMERMVVVTAARPLDAGEELTVKYDTTSPGATLYRFGFVP